MHIDSPDTSAHSAASISASTGLVLVVEDEPGTRGEIADLLKSAGLTVEEAADGREALEKASLARFDAILLDLVMPGMDGWQFRETQLRHPQLASVPTVVITARPLREPDRYVLRPTAVVVKPIDDVRLLAVVHRVVSISRQSPMAEAPRPTASAGQLFWSKRGEVACQRHAPEGNSERWIAEAWAPIPPAAGFHGIAYQCQHCGGSDGPIRHIEQTAR